MNKKEMYKQMGETVVAPVSDKVAERIAAPDRRHVEFLERRILELEKEQTNLRSMVKALERQMNHLKREVYKVNRKTNA